MNARRIRLMADYQCSPLWEPGGDPYVINPEDLPLSEALRARLWAWATAFDGTLNLDDPANSGFESAQAKQAFIQEGMNLKALLQAELGPTFIVEYQPRR